MRVIRTFLSALALGAVCALGGALPGAVSEAKAAERMVDLSSGTGSFVGDGPRLLEGDDFITFTNLGPGTYTYKFTLSGEGIDGLAASVNGQNAGTFTVGERRFAGLEGRDNGSFTVQITGRPAGNAVYQGELVVTPEPLPEPAGPALLLSGLATLAGWAAWRGWRGQRRAKSKHQAAPPA